MRAVWKNTVIAENANTVVVEGNHYFPHESLKREHFRDSSHHSVCPSNGTASYLDVVASQGVNNEAAWYYPDPKPTAAEIRGRVAFWRGVKVQA